MEEEQRRLRRPKEAFNFEALPLELKHEVLKKLKTKYLEDVCANVSQSWEGMVEDILEQRKVNVGAIVPAFFKKEIAMRTRHEDLVNNPLELLKCYENSMISRFFGAKSVVVNSDVITSRAGLMKKVWDRRNCVCNDYSECLMRKIHILHAFNLFILSSDADHGSLKFYHLSDIELLESKHEVDDIVSYDAPRVDEWIGNNYSADITISVFRDHIALEKAAKTILLLKVVSVNHLLRQVVVERVRLVHLPLWTSALCLFEDKLVVLYTTGHIGMWDKTKDELFISERKCDLEVPDPRLLHRNKLFRIGSLALVRAGSKPIRWYVVDLDDCSLKIRQINFMKLLDSGLLPLKYRFKTHTVCQMDIYFNCLIINLRCESTDPNKRAFVTMLVFKRIQRYPTVEDFFDPEKFRTEFLAENSNDDKLVRVQSSIWTAFSSPFTPSCLNQWHPEPSEDKPGPVADLIAAQVARNTSLDPVQTELRAVRIRIANLPFKR